MRYLALALFAGVWTATALYAFPAIDDGWLWMLEDEKGYSLIADSMSDRPFIGEIWQWLSMHGLLWPTAPLIHFATWFGFGVVTLKLYERLDPTSPRLATCAGVLCLSAIPFEEKHVLVTYTWTSCISVLLVYVALLIELRSPEAMPGSRSPRKDGLLLLLQAAIIAVAGVLTEYTVGALIAASMLILAGSSSYQLSIRTRYCVVGVYAIAGVAGLAVLNWFKPAQSYCQILWMRAGLD